MATQIAGALLGEQAAHLMFELPGVADFNPSAQRTRAMVVGSRGDVWPAADDLGLRGARSDRCTLRGWPLDDSGLLVHGLDVVRQPSRDDRPRAVGHLCGIAPSGVAMFILAQATRTLTAVALTHLVWAKPAASRPITRLPCEPTRRRLFGGIVTVDRFG